MWSDFGPPPDPNYLLTLLRALMAQGGTPGGLPHPGWGQGDSRLRFPVMGPGGATGYIPGTGWVGGRGFFPPEHLPGAQPYPAAPAPSGLGPLLPGSAAPEPLPPADPNAYETRGWGQSPPMHYPVPRHFPPDLPGGLPTGPNLIAGHTIPPFRPPGPGQPWGRPPPISRRNPTFRLF
jgi:hypothetical protein